MSKHPKNGPILMHFYMQPAIEEFEAIANFDDRTLASLVGTVDGGRPTLPCDGRDEDEPYHTLPLKRWADMGTPSKRHGGSR